MSTQLCISYLPDQPEPRTHESLLQLYAQGLGPASQVVCLPLSPLTINPGGVLGGYCPMAVSGALRESQTLLGSGLGLEDVGEDPLCRAVDGHEVDEISRPTFPK